MSWGGVIWSVGTLLALYLVVVPSLRPYIIFDSPKTEKSQKQWDWFVRGFLTFIVFGTLFA